MRRICRRICVTAVMLAAVAANGFSQEAKTQDAKAQEAKKLPVPDERYKLDILLVVAHPDDEAAATSYLARAMDEGKRVGVAYTTRGSSGANDVR